jgi:hypothetical protein
MAYPLTTSAKDRLHACSTLYKGKEKAVMHCGTHAATPAPACPKAGGGGGKGAHLSIPLWIFPNT